MSVVAVILLLLVLIAIGVPVGFALGIAGAVGLYAFSGASVAASILSDVAYQSSASYLLLTIPMFILMSQYMAVSGMARDVINASYEWLGRIPGGLGIACVAASAIMAAVIGSSTASTAAMATAGYPHMKRLDYHPGFAIGIIAISGTLAIMIPPSIILVLYGILTEESIGKLLIAGIIPGLLTAFGYAAVIFIRVYFNPSLAPTAGDFDFRRAVRALAPVWPVLILMFCVIGSLYYGIATPTEAGALGAAAALLIAIALRRLNWSGLTESLQHTVKATTMIVTIIIGAMIFGYFMTYTQVTQQMIKWVSESGLAPWQIMVAILVVYVILGMFLDQIAILVLTVPLTYPLVKALGYDGIWYGILITKTVEIGLVTPPVGLNVYIGSSIAKVPLTDAFRGITPFVFVELVILAILALFPNLILYLPSLMR
jgi:tripartite ATP-independent transporter DctM subunit